MADRREEAALWARDAIAKKKKMVKELLPQLEVASPQTAAAAIKPAESAMTKLVADGGAANMPPFTLEG